LDTGLLCSFALSGRTLGSNARLLCAGSDGFILSSLSGSFECLRVS
jgi:hypothetical protein